MVSVQSVEFSAALTDFHHELIVVSCVMQTVAQNSRTENLNVQSNCAKQQLVNHVINFS